MNASRRPMLFPPALLQQMLARYRQQIAAQMAAQMSAIPAARPFAFVAPTPPPYASTPIEQPAVPTAPVSESARQLTRWDDDAAMQVLQQWRQMFTDTAPLPGIGMPSQGNGVLTFTHTMSLPGMPPPPPMTINGLRSRSPLANNALGSFELSEGRWLNLYETMLPDIAGAGGAPSSVQRYVDSLQRQGVSVAGNHYHWSGGEMMGKFALAIHSQTTGTLDPIQFTQAHLAAFRDFLAAIPRSALHAR